MDWRYAKLPVFLSSFSALDRYFRLETGRYLSLASCSGLAELAAGFPIMEFPGVDDVDAYIPEEGELFPGGLLCCDLSPSRLEAETGYPVPLCQNRFPQLNLIFDPRTGRFFDPQGIYPSLRDPVFFEEWTPGPPPLIPDWELWLDAAILAARYGYKVIVPQNDPPDQGFPEERSSGKIVPVFRQKEALIRILEGANPAAGLLVLRHCGFLQRYWPELGGMIQVGQNKEYHPEGDVWDHTMATFEYRKTGDLRLGLALLLHDIGKPFAEEQQGNKFHNHAQIGGQMAFHFLTRLGFSPEDVRITVFLVEEHMTPGFAKTQAAGRVRDVMASELYPLLLELYRCDLSSTFRGPEAYYDACRVYRQFLKNKANPFRDGRGRKKTSGAQRYFS